MLKTNGSRAQPFRPARGDLLTTPIPMPTYAPRLDTSVAEPDILTIPEIEIIPEIDEPGSGSGEYRVILYDDDWHPIDQVVAQVIKACECGKIKAIKITLEAHKKGRAVCYKGRRDKCHKVARVLREIRLQCEVDSDD